MPQRILCLTLLPWLAIGCGGGGSGPAADPPGTVSSDLRVRGQGPNSIAFATGLIGTSGDLSLDSAGNFVASAGVTIADAGLVQGLGAVIAVPSAGFVASASAVVGHGYVVRLQSFSYVRVFVAADIIGATTGGVIGKTLQWAFLKKMVSYAISPANASIPKGLKQQFTLSGTYDDGSPVAAIPAAQWSASVGAVTIGGTGLATSYALGTATVSAYLVFNGPAVATTQLTVVAPALTSIALLPKNPTIVAGTSEQFAAIGTFSDGTTQDVTATATFTSSTPAVAQSSGSTATSASLGTTTITALAGTLSATSTLTVTSPPFATPVTGRGYATSNYINNLFVFDTGTEALVATIPLGAASTEGIAVDAAAHRVYVGSSASGIAVIDTDANTASRLTVSAGGGFALNAAANRLYALGGGVVSAVDTATGTLVTSVTLNKTNPYVSLDGIVLDQGKAFVTESSGNAVAVVDLATNSLVTTLSMGNTINGAARAPSWITLDAAAHRAYVSNMADGSVSVIDTRANVVTTNFAAGTASAGTAGIALDPQRHRLYVTAQDSGLIAVVDTTTNTKVATVTLTPSGKVQSGFLAVDVAANKIYAPYYNSVSVVDGASNTQIGVVTWGSVSPFPFTIALAP
jgi:YVTN family beta-propeller protein